MDKPINKAARPSINEILIRKAQTQRYECIDSPVEGVKLRQEVGSKSRIVKEVFETLSNIGRVVLEGRNLIEETKKKLVEPEQTIKTAADRYKGFSGLEFTEDNTQVRLTKKATLKNWAKPLLRKALGKSYADFVSEEFNYRVRIPAGSERVGRTETAVSLRKQFDLGVMAVLGATTKDLASMTDSELRLKVDEASLGNAIAEGKFSLEDTTAEVESSWALEVAPITKPKPAV